MRLERKRASEASGGAGGTEAPLLLILSLGIIAGCSQIIGTDGYKAGGLVDGGAVGGSAGSVPSGGSAGTIAAGGAGGEAAGAGSGGSGEAGGEAGSGATAGSAGAGGEAGSGAAAGSGGTGAQAGVGGSAGGGAAGAAGGGTGGTGGVGATGGTGGTGGTGAIGGTGGVCNPPAGVGICDTTPQCGCSGNETCTVVNFSTGATDCRTPGPIGPYASCAVSDCQSGLMCVADACHTFCENAASSCGGYAECIAVSSGGNNVPGLFVCTRTCDPINPQLDDATFDPCGAGLGCYPATDGASDCFGPVTPAGTQGKPCNSAGQPEPTLCAAGYGCIEPSLTCAKFCHTGGNDCTGGQTCTDIGGLSAGPQGIGVCLGGGGTYTSTDAFPLSIPDNDIVTGRDSIVVVSGGPASVSKITVQINVTHTWDEDLDIYLRSPTGTRIELSTDNGVSGDHYVATIFDDAAATSISAGTPPFTGTFRPEQVLSTFNGQNANGTWHLEVYDDVATDTGTLDGWSITIN